MEKTQKKTCKSISSSFKNIQAFVDESIEGKMNRHLEIRKEIKPLSTKDTISISGLPYLCPREEALATRDNKIRTDRVPPSLRAIFETGNAFQDIIRDLTMVEDGFLLGMWKCRECDFVHGSTDGESWKNNRGATEAHVLERIPKPEKCNTDIEGYGRCLNTSFEYVEEILENRHMKLKGHPDGFLSNRMYDHVLEIKTTNDFRFKVAKTKPFKEHLIQANIYAWIAGKKRILLLYFNKNNGQFWTWDLAIDNDIIKETIDKVKATWEAIEEFEAKGEISKLPERICQTPRDTRAKKCQLCKECFL